MTRLRKTSARTSRSLPSLVAAILATAAFSVHAQPSPDWQNNGNDIYYTSGNVGIGMTAPSEKLMVEGTIKAREVVVNQDSWPDFVFDEGYELEPLDEVEAWIRARGHLPGVPSADEVRTRGVAVGEMQAALLRKVEELTLYLIELRNENLELRDRVASLEDRD